MVTLDPAHRVLELVIGRDARLRTLECISESDTSIIQKDEGRAGIRLVSHKVSGKPDLLRSGCVDWSQTRLSVTCIPNQERIHDCW